MDLDVNGKDQNTRPGPFLAIIFFACFCLGLVLSFFTEISYALVIVSPKDGQIFQEGDTVKIVAELSSNDPEILYVTFSTTKALDNCDEVSTHPHYECTFLIPHGGPRVIEIAASAPTSGAEVVESQKIAIIVSVPPSVTLQSLGSFNGNRIFLSKIGENEKLYILGHYSDAVERRLDDPVSGTTYQTSEPKVATVNEKGIVTAVAPGKTIITVKNGDKKLQLEVIVKLK